MAGYALIEAVKAKKGLTSDNQLALMLGKDRQNISNWKNKDKAKPDTESILDLMILGDIDAKEAKRLLHGGFASVSLLVTTAVLGIVLLLGVAKHSQDQAIARGTVQNNVYYVKLRKLIDKLLRVFNIV
jgi:hypothetical protein